jgi:5'-nucleotidase
MKKTILLTNDDGIESPGIWKIAEGLVSIAEVWIAAPRTQYTGAGRCFFIEDDGIITKYPLRFESENLRAFSIGASPAQCVYQAVEEILPVKPDLVVSGINYGENLGTVVTGSGTIGAAIEAAIIGLKAMAISLEILPEEGYRSHSDSVDFSAAASFGRRFALAILSEGLPEGVDILKVDVPREADSDTPWEVTKISRMSGMARRIIREEANQNAQIYWYPDSNRDKTETDSDLYAVVHDRKVSVSPMTIDMTADCDFSALRKRLEKGG